MTTNSQETSTNSQEPTTNIQETSTNSQESTTEQGKEEPTTISQETTTDQQEITTNSQETTTQENTTNAPHSSNGNNSCPPLEQGQNYFVCPTGFRRHPQDCNMFYQCTESPETSHYSIVTFQCPNDTVYDEEGIMCRDRRPDDNCKSNMNETTRILMDLETNNSTAVRLTQFIRINLILNFLVPNSNETITVRGERSLPLGGG